MELTDRIFIRDLLVRGICGINPDERVNKQDLRINIVMHCNMQKAGESDNIEDAVNYRSVCKDVIGIVERSQFYLIEKLVTVISDHILTHYPVDDVQVTVDKPGALRFAESVAVEIGRNRVLTRS